MEGFSGLVNDTASSLTGVYHFFIEKFSIDGIIKMMIVYVFIIWGAFIVWVIKDITNRTTNLFLQVFSIFIVLLLTPIFGLPIYLLIRPRSTLFEQYYEESGLALEEEEEFPEPIKRCHHCHHHVDKDFKFCPHCETMLLGDCRECKKTIQTDWTICPYCGIHEPNKKTEVEEKKVKKSAKKVVIEKKSR